MITREQLRFTNFDVAYQTPDKSLVAACLLRTLLSYLRSLSTIRTDRALSTSRDVLEPTEDVFGTMVKEEETTKYLVACSFPNANW